MSESSIDVALDAAEQPLNVLTALQAVQDHVGHVPDEAIPTIAARCNASRADVYGVLTYYSDLRTSPAPATLVRVCLGEACQSVGARQLHAAAERLAASRNDIAPVGVEHVYCLGNCALGPTAEVSGRVMGRLTDSRLSALLEEGWG